MMYLSSRGLKEIKDFISKQIQEAEQRGYERGRNEQFADGTIVMSPNEVGSLIKKAEQAKTEERKRILESIRKEWKKFGPLKLDEIVRISETSLDNE